MIKWMIEKKQMQIDPIVNGEKYYTVANENWT